MLSTNKRLTWTVVVAVALVFGVTLAVAELADVYLKSGVRLRGEVTKTDTEVIVRNDLGEARYRLDQVDRIVPLGTTTQPATQPAERPESHATTQPASGPVAAEPTTRGAPGGVVLLTPLDIQRLKMSELRTDGPPEKLRVRFAGKDQREAAERILKELRQRPDFRAEWEATLQRGTMPEKLQLIVAETGTRFVDQLIIADDPAAFETFRLRVLPIVTKTCARSGCHTAGDDVGLRLPTNPTHGEPVVYTTFALLDHVQTSQGPMINRDDPEASALLSYLLAEKTNPRPHPPVNGKPAFTPPLRNVRNPLYEQIKTWINSLQTPHPNYGLDYRFGDESPAAQPTSQPATQPAEAP